MDRRIIYIFHCVAWKQTNSFSVRWVTRLAQADHSIITSSGLRWWVSKAVSCHRNPQQTANSTEGWAALFQLAPFLPPPSYSHTAQWSRRRCGVRAALKTRQNLSIFHGADRRNVSERWESHPKVLTCFSVSHHFRRKSFSEAKVTQCYRSWLKEVNNILEQRLFSEGRDMSVD